MKFVCLFVLLVHALASLSQPEEKWNFQTKGKVYSSPAINGNVLYIGSADQHLYAIDKKSGKELWRFKTGGAVHSSPAVASGLVFFSSHDGFIYALTTDTGKLAWKYRTKGEKIYDLWDYYLSSPIIHNGVVYVGSGDNHVYALNAKTGQIAWKFSTDGIVHSSPVISDSLLYIGSFDGNLYALRLSSGKLHWKYKTKGETYFPKGEIQRDAVIHDGMVYFGSRDYNLYAVDAIAGSLKWSIKENGSWVVAPPLAYKGKLYVGTSDSEAFYCIDARNGKINWKQNLNMRVFGAAIRYKEQIIFGCFNGKIYGVDSETGLTQWEFQTRGSKLNYPNVYDESGAFRKDFEKYGKDVEGSEQKILSLGSILCTPLIDDGVVYFGSSDGQVYALTLE